MNQNLPNRKDARLKSWDYSTAATYHITICAKDRLPLFGYISEDSEDRTGSDARVILSDIGECCLRAINLAVETYDGFDVDIFVIMPNHIHLLIAVDDAKPKGSVASFVSFIKGKATRAARELYPGCVIWQARYYDHIIRDERDYQSTWEYIVNNPAKWREDRYWVEGRTRS